MLQRLFVMTPRQRKELELLIHRLVDAARDSANADREGDKRFDAFAAFVNATVKVSEKLDEMEVS